MMAMRAGAFHAISGVRGAMARQTITGGDTDNQNSLTTTACGVMKPVVTATRQKNNSVFMNSKYFVEEDLDLMMKKVPQLFSYFLSLSFTFLFVPTRNHRRQ